MAISETKTNHVSSYIGFFVDDAMFAHNRRGKGHANGAHAGSDSPGGSTGGEVLTSMIGACCRHRSVLNILGSLLANHIPAKGVVTIICRIEIRKMAEC